MATAVYRGVTEGEISREFSEAAANPDLISRCLRICRDYRLTASELQVEWDLLTMNRGPKKMTLDALADLEACCRDAQSSKRQKTDRSNRPQFSARTTTSTFDKDTAHLLAGVDLLVAPTRYEAYGLGVHEALCCGVPVLVSEDAGVAERLPETLSGMTLPARVDAPALAEALEQALATLDDARGAVAPVGAELRSRTWDAMASELVEAMA